MKILKEKSTGTGSTINGEAIMLSRYGDIVNVIDNKYHPNAGPKEDGYPEIERCIDWCLCNMQYCYPILKSIDGWINNRVYKEVKENPEISLDETILNVMYSDYYTPCRETVRTIKRAYDEYTGQPNSHPHGSEIEYAEDIVSFINERFTRVRAGGKLNPEGSNSIYFRISSHYFDWHSVIVDFLWDVFKDPKKMPKRIWIGHDAENNPPETVLFDGTPEELLEKADDKVFESKKFI